MHVNLGLARRILIENKCNKFTQLIIQLDTNHNMIHPITLFFKQFLYPFYFILYNTIKIYFFVVRKKIKQEK